MCSCNCSKARFHGQNQRVDRPLGDGSQYDDIYGGSYLKLSFAYVHVKELSMHDIHMQSGAAAAGFHETFPHGCQLLLLMLVI